jgi:hypothetical protein
MTLQTVLNHVPRELLEEFQTYLATGEASAAFIARLDQDPALDELADQALEIMLKHLAEKPSVEVDTHKLPLEATAQNCESPRPPRDALGRRND